MFLKKAIRMRASANIHGYPGGAMFEHVVWAKYS